MFHAQRCEKAQTAECSTFCLHLRGTSTAHQLFKSLQNRIIGHISTWEITGWKFCGSWWKENSGDVDSMVEGDQKVWGTSSLPVLYRCVRMVRNTSTVNVSGSSGSLGCSRHLPPPTSHLPPPLCALQEYISPSCTNDNGLTLYSLWGFLPCNSLPGVGGGGGQPVQRLLREIPMGATWLSITAFPFLLCGETLAQI